MDKSRSGNRIGSKVMSTVDTSATYATNQPQTPTILIIENETSNRILIERVLSTRGYHCISATNGLEALNILEQERVSLILTDLSMPVMDGYRTTQLIRARPGMEGVPIVAVTAYAQSDENEAALQIGCNEYLTKPFKPRQLLEVVDRLLPAK